MEDSANIPPQTAENRHPNTEPGTKNSNLSEKNLSKVVIQGANKQNIGQEIITKGSGMKYLIKDLAKLSGLSPARIRKWQERYRIFDPEQADNGYYYYSNDDLFVLKRVQSRLIKGERLSDIVAEGRPSLLPPKEPNRDGIQNPIQRWVANNKYDELENYFEAERAKRNFHDWIRHTLQQAVVEVGIGWENGVLSVADEHTFSRWFAGYFSRFTREVPSQAPTWLVAVYHGDEHELGALLHYSILLRKDIHVKYVGRLPHDELVKELAAGKYDALSLSFVSPIKNKIVQNYRKTLKKRFPKMRIHFGGYGYRHRL